jgi:hypothetical protein
VHRNGNAKVAACVVKQAGVAASLVVDIKTNTLKGAENLFGFEDW